MFEISFSIEAKSREISIYIGIWEIPRLRGIRSGGKLNSKLSVDQWKKLHQLWGWKNDWHIYAICKHLRTFAQNFKVFSCYLVSFATNSRKYACTICLLNAVFALIRIYLSTSPPWSSIEFVREKVYLARMLNCLNDFLPEKIFIS